MHAEAIRVTGTVQGVGFRPTVWRLARECGVVGDVRNDAEGVLIHAWGEDAALASLTNRLLEEQPPLSRIESIARTPLAHAPDAPRDFSIVASDLGDTATDVAADAATCADCLDEVMDPHDRRYRYPFTNCTHCGPRLSIIRSVPYDRANTSMASFTMCDECRAEYEDPANRRFHAQPNACPACGPRAWLEDAAGNRVMPDADCDAVGTAASRLRDGSIVAVKGIGGFHLACDATNAAAVGRLRQRKHRYQKALAMMARDLDVVRRYAVVGLGDAETLTARQAPIVILDAHGEQLPEAIAPGQATLGFMLPYTPLHHLLMRDIIEPVVMTSGNRSDEPQVVDNDEARARLGEIADFFLMHDREIVNRLDDSVACDVAGEVRFLRRARGHAPEPISLGAGFESAGPVLAMGGELKNTFCLLDGGRAIVSQHIGDMEDAAALRDYSANLALYRSLYDFVPDRYAVDAHPDYIPTRTGIEEAGDRPVIEVQHHHAHVASCMAEHGFAIDADPVLGIVLDGLGLGDDGSFWGGEFLAANFAGYRRLARFAPVPMPGGAKAMREPWRNTWAHLREAFGWELASRRFASVDAVRFLGDKPVDLLEQMAIKGLNSPLGSSAGRLFDAVAAALGVCRESIAHEAQAAIELEALAAAGFDEECHRGYVVDLVDDGLMTLGWQSLWAELLDDIGAGIPRETIAARFHHGLADGICNVAIDLCGRHGYDTVVLGGGVFQNRLLLATVTAQLSTAGLDVRVPRRLPANDGGLSLGQAAIAARRTLEPN